MHRATIIEMVANATGISKVEVSAVLEGVLGTIEKGLAAGETVELRRFGTFRCVQRAPRRAVNPRTGEPISVDARIVPTFKPSPKLRDAVKKAKI